MPVKDLQDDRRTIVDIHPGRFLDISKLSRCQLVVENYGMGLRRAVDKPHNLLELPFADEGSRPKAGLALGDVRHNFEAQSPHQALQLLKRGFVFFNRYLRQAYTDKNGTRFRVR